MKKLRRVLLPSLLLFVLLPLLCMHAAASDYPMMPSDWQGITVKIGDAGSGYTTLPLAEYQDGAYWDPDKCTMSCSEASQYGISRSSDIQLKGWQCVGFARYTYAACFFRYSQNAYMSTGIAYDNESTSYYTALGSLPAGYTAAQVRSLLLQAVPGSVMRISGHSMVIMAIFEDGVLIYDANFSSANEVDVRAYTWDSFASKLGSRGINAVQVPKYYPGYTYYYYGIEYNAANASGIWLDRSAAGEYITCNYSGTLNVRTSPSISSSVVTVLPLDSVISVIGTYNGWAAFYYNGTLCWASTDYIRAYDYRVTVSFDANGGSVNTASRVYNAAQAFGDLPVPVKTNRTFVGWYANDQFYYNDSIVPKASSLALTASWCIYEFRDVPENAWFASNVEQGVANGLISRDDYFRPNDKASRAEFVTVLSRSHAKRTGTSIGSQLTCSFTDVSSSAYYFNPVCWAYANRIVLGTTETTFSPYTPITREQIATILYRYAVSCGLESDYTRANKLWSYPDGYQTSSYAVNPMNWAISIGLYLGDNSGRLNPGNNATRAEMVTVFTRFLRYYNM